MWLALEVPSHCIRSGQTLLMSTASGHYYRYVLAALVVALLVVLIVSSLIVRRIATVKLFSDGSDQFWPVAAPYEEEEEDFVVRYREFDGVQLRSR